jgi:hypothetical protein
LLLWTKISAAIKQLEEDQKRLIEAARRMVNGVGEKGKGVDLNEYRLVEGGPKGLAWMNTPLNLRRRSKSFSAP